MDRSRFKNSTITNNNILILATFRFDSPSHVQSVLVKPHLHRDKNKLSLFILATGMKLL